MNNWIKKWIEVSEDEYETPTELVVEPRGDGWSAELICDPDWTAGKMVCSDFRSGNDFMEVIDVTKEKVIERLNRKCELDLESMMFI